MSLDVLTKKLTEANFRYVYRPDGSVLWPIQGRYVIHPFVVTEEPRGRVRMSVLYPVPNVEDVPGLCREISQYLRLAQLALTDAGRTFTLFVCSTPGEVGDDAELLSAYADDVHALLEHLREGMFKPGTWDHLLVGLALLDPEECTGRA